MAKQILVTSALPYVNNVPHLGNIIGSTLSADVYARFKRKQGHKVLYVCGSDQYGTSTEVKALEEGLSHQELCDKYHAIHQSVYEWFNLSFDIWGQTTNASQTELTQRIFLDLWKNGHIEEKEVVQLFCEECNRFISDRYVYGLCYHEGCKGVVKGDQCDACCRLVDVSLLKKRWCFLCNNMPVEKVSPHLFIKLGDFEKPLREYFLGSDGESSVFLSPTARTITETWLLPGVLDSRCITRDLVWGTPFPNRIPGLEKYEGKVFYVWFDAPIGYLSILKDGLEKRNEKLACMIRYFKEVLFLGDVKLEAYPQFDGSHDYLRVPDGVILDDAYVLELERLYEREVDWRGWIPGCDDGREWAQFMAKDNVLFHSVFFPSTIMGANLGLDKSCGGVTHLSATEYLTHEGKKFSKSGGVGIFGDKVREISETLGIDEDYFRFYLIKIRPENGDSDFNWQDFAGVIKGELVNKISNLVHRYLILLKKLTVETTVSLKYDFDGVGGEYARELNEVRGKYIESFDGFCFREVIKCIIRCAEIGNKYFQECQPWKLDSLDHVCLGNIGVIIYLMSELLEPICPRKAFKIKTYVEVVAFGIPFGIPFGIGNVIIKLVDVEMLFKKIDLSLIV